jgi:hypothetical protein
MSFDRGVTHPLVAVDKGMVLDQGEAQRRCLRDKGGVEIVATEGLLRLTESGLEKSKITKTMRTAGLGDDQVVKLQNLSEAEVTRHRQVGASNGTKSRSLHSD